MKKKNKPSVISGVSAGAVVGALLCAGKSAEEIHQLLKSQSVLNIGNPSLTTKGLLRFKGLRKLIKDNVKVSNIEDLKTPLHVVVTNLYSGKAEYLTEGPIDKLVAASASIPVLFTPLKYKNALCADEDIIDNLGAKPLKGKCDKIIGMSLSHVDHKGDINGMVDIALRVFHLTVNANTQGSNKLCDILIEPKGIGEFPILSSDKSDEAFEIGYEAAKLGDL